MLRRSQPEDNFANSIQDSSSSELNPELELFPATALQPASGVLPVPEPKVWLWVWMGMSVCLAAGGMAIGAFLWLVSLPPATDCEKISTLSTDRDRLYCAQTAASTGEVPDLLASIKLVGQWHPEHSLYPEAQSSLAEWSETLLQVAQDKIDDNDLEGAIELVQQIPQSSPTYEEARAALAEWETGWAAGKTIYAEAQDAIKQQNWDLASEKISALSKLEFEYWRSQQTVALSKQILAEQRAQRSLIQAQNLAQRQTPERLAGAIKTVSQIDRETYVWQKAQVNFNQWSEVLLSAGLEQWQAKNLDSAIAIGKQVSLNPALAKDAQHLIWLAEARKQAIASLSTWESSADQVWHLIQAIAIANQIGSDSRFYPQAKASLEGWQAQLQDLTQLQIAQLMANFHQLETLHLAIAQAKIISPDRPRRIQAQTLIAHWNHEIERIEDRPHLIKARHLAASGEITALRDAIAQAKQVAPGRVLRNEAQGLIARWQQDIERIQDQPILDRARQLAAQREWNAAIQEASQIESGRALYSEARGAIASWRAEIRAIERRNRARQEAAAAERQAETNPIPEFSIEEENGYLNQPAPASPATSPSAVSEPFPFNQERLRLEPPAAESSDNFEEPAPPPIPEAVEPPPPPPMRQEAPIEVEPAPKPPSAVEMPISTPTPTAPENIPERFSRLPEVNPVAPEETPVIYTGALYLGMV
jgi:hypothetical protein